MSSLLTETPLALVLVIVGVLLILALAFWARYKTVGAEEALIVTGSMLGSKNVMSDQSGKKIKIIRGGGAFIIPIFQQAELLSLLSHKLQVSTPEVYTAKGVPIIV
ncbi:MAG: flotillin family protein, partial [Thermoactinomyces sp.]